MQRTYLRVKSLLQTRWFAQHDACYALEKEWSAITDALEYFTERGDDKPTNNYTI